MNYILQKFAFGVGGILRWLFFQIINIPMNDKFQKNIDYYSDNESDTKDRNGFTNRSKNGLTFLLFILLMIIILEKI